MSEEKPKTQVRIRCENGHERELSPAQVERQSPCPHCHTRKMRGPILAVVAMLLLTVSSTAHARPSLHVATNESAQLGARSGLADKGWSPTWIVGLSAWYFAGDLGIVIATGISSWPDASGNGHTLTQATGSKQPTLNASDAAYKGCATASFAAASSQVVSTASFSLTAQPITEWVVGNMSNTAITETFLDWKTGGPTTLYNAGAGGQVYMYAGANLGHAVASNATPAVYTAAFNTTTSALYSNSATTTLAAGNVGTGAPTGGIALGAQSGTSAYLLGKIAEAAVVSHLADVYERTRMGTYESNRYGMSFQ